MLHWHERSTNGLFVVFPIKSVNKNKFSRYFKMFVSFRHNNNSSKSCIYVSSKQIAKFYKKLNPVLTQTAHDSLSAKLKWDRWGE